MAQAIIWCRVSTTKQEFETQKKELIAKALNDGFNKSDLIIIGEAGASAIKMNDLYQKEVDLLLKTIENTKTLSTIYVWEVSRLARNEVAFYQMKETIVKNKIQFICNVPQIKLLKDDGEVNGGMEITLNLLATVAKQEMEIKIKRFARGKQRKAEERKYSGGRIPYGYRIDKERDNLIVVDEKQGEIVKLIYDLYEKGMSQPKIAKELNDTGKANIKISLINHILINESYTGKKRKTKNASYERSYDPIITQEQFDRCRQIAKENNTNLSKAKNVYYAEHLVRCSSCGAYWSASGSKASYHCSAACKAASLWNYEYHKKERCHNKTSISINILDSILWRVAIQKEACFIEQATDETIHSYLQESDIIKEKIKNIEPRIKEQITKRERLQEAYIDGLSKEIYNRRKQNIAETISSIKLEEIRYNDELKHLNEIILDLQNRQTYKPITKKDIISVINGEVEGVSTLYPSIHHNLVQKISQISDDNERYKIIHRQIKKVEIKPVVIRYPFKSGEKDVKCRSIIVHTYIPSTKEKEENKTEGIMEYYAIPNGGNGPIIIDIYLDMIDDETPYLFDYDFNDYVPFDDISHIYLNRFHDNPKRKRRNSKSIEIQKEKENKLSIKEIRELYGLPYHYVYNQIHIGRVPSQMIGGQLYVDIDVAEKAFGENSKPDPTTLDD